jgi:TPR repeat protein
MDNAPSLKTAKLLIRERRLQEAAAMLDRIIDQKSNESGEAAYSLGILYHSGGGVAKDLNEAEKFFLVAERYGNPLATYRLGGMYYRRGDFKKAYDSFRSVAQDNPSAAYWAYRVLIADRRVDKDPDASRKHLNNAAAQGHVVAQRTLAMRYVLGREGFAKIPCGFVLYAKAMVDIFRVVVIHDDKMKYE